MQIAFAEQGQQGGVMNDLAGELPPLPGVFSVASACIPEFVATAPHLRAATSVLTRSPTLRHNARTRRATYSGPRGLRLR